jgi:hypothetical protein
LCRRAQSGDTSSEIGSASEIGTASMLSRLGSRVRARRNSSASVSAAQPRRASGSRLFKQAMDQLRRHEERVKRENEEAKAHAKPALCK